MGYVLILGLVVLAWIFGFSDSIEPLIPRPFTGLLLLLFSVIAVWLSFRFLNAKGKYKVKLNLLLGLLHLCLVILLGVTISHSLKHVDEHVMPEWDIFFVLDLPSSLLYIPIVLTIEAAIGNTIITNHYVPFFVYAVFGSLQYYFIGTRITLFRGIRREKTSDIDDKITRLYYKLGSLRQNFPANSLTVDEKYIKEYHSIVHGLEKVINSELSEFKISDNEIKAKKISYNPMIKEITRSNFMVKLDSLLNYVQINYLSPEKRTTGLKKNDYSAKQLPNSPNKRSNRLKGIFRRRFTAIDAATLMANILLDKERNIFVDGIFNLPNNNLLEKGYNKDKMIMELSLFDDFCLLSHLPQEALRFKKKELAERIWNEYRTILKRRMGEAAYNDFVTKSTQRREVYSKIFSLKHFESTVPWVFWGYVLDETPRYLLESFDVKDSPDFFATEQLNLYLNKSKIELAHTCRDILKKTEL